MNRAQVANIYFYLNKIKNSKDSNGNDMKFKKNFIINSFYNMNETKKEYDLLSEFITKIDEMKSEYMEKEKLIVTSFCLKGEDGNPFIQNNMYCFESRDVEMKCVEALKDKLGSLKNEIENKLNELKEVESEEVDLKIENLRKIKEDDLPEDIDFKMYEALSIIIED